MSSPARIIGILILLQIIGSATVNFGLEMPLFQPPGFLANAAPHSRQIAVGALLGVVIEALWIGIAVTAFPILWERSRAVALWFFALAVVILAAAVAEAAGVMSMISVSEAYAKASAAGREQLESVRVIVSSARNWAHYLAKILDGATILLFYAALYRFTLVPRPLAGFCVLAAVSMVTGISMAFLGDGVVFPLLAPLGFAQLFLALWLIAKGFPRN